MSLDQELKAHHAKHHPDRVYPFIGQTRRNADRSAFNVDVTKIVNGVRVGVDRPYGTTWLRVESESGKGHMVVEREQATVLDSHSAIDWLTYFAKRRTPWSWFAERVYIEIADLKVGMHYWIRFHWKRNRNAERHTGVGLWEGGQFRGGTFSIIGSDECFSADEYHFEIISEIIPPEGL